MEDERLANPVYFILSGAQMGEVPPASERKGMRMRCFQNDHGPWEKRIESKQWSKNGMVLNLRLCRFMSMVIRCLVLFGQFTGPIGTDSARVLEGRSLGGLSQVVPCMMISGVPA